MRKSALLLRQVALDVVAGDAVARARRLDVRELRRIVKSVATQGTGWGAIGEAEVHFHTTLTAACGNRLAMLFAHVYEPIFQVDRDTQPTAASRWSPATG